MATNDSNETTPADESPDKIAKLEAQINDYKMLLADMQNSTRRLKEDADKQKKYFAEPLASDVLSLLDNLQRASDTAIEVLRIFHGARNITPDMFTGV